MLVAATLLVPIGSPPGPAGAAAAGTITTVAGIGVHGFGGDGGPATAAQLWGAKRVALAPDGDMYIADSFNNRVRRIDSATGVITTVAGTGTRGYNGDGRLATTAQLAGPEAVDVALDGTLYIAEYVGHRVRRVHPTTGIITTVAGTGEGGYNGDARLATTAEIFHPSGVAVDRSGNLFIADTFGYRIRKVTPAGMISTAAGVGLGGSFDDGPATAVAARVPLDVAVDPAGNLYFVEYSFHRVRRVDARTGITSTIAGTHGVAGSTGDGGPAVDALVHSPGGIDVDGAGNVYVADAYNSRVRRISSLTGEIETIAGTGIAGDEGDGGPARSAQLRQPFGVTVTPQGALLIADGSRIRRVDPAAVPPVRDPHAAQQRLVIAAHHDLLERDPSPRALWDQGADLGTGRITRAAYLGGLTTSEEWVTAVVERMYVDTLGRAGDPAGVAYWVAEIRSGRRTVAQTAAWLYASNEYYLGRGGGTLGTWVDDLYRALLGRAADASGRAFWVAQAQVRGRPSVALSFFQTDESARRRVAMLYDRLLGRAASASDLTFWAPRVQSRGDLVLARDLAISAEYFDRAQRRFP